VGVERLSDELTTSWWAYVRRATLARAHPSENADPVARLPARTPFGSRELVLVLEHCLLAGQEWMHVRLPVRPCDQTAWIRRSSLGRLREVRRSFRVEVDARSAVLARGGRELWSGPVVVGTEQWPTPRGRFYVRARIRGTRSAPLYGAFAFCTNGFVPRPLWPGGDLVAIHGTNRPELVPGAYSKGCIRVRDSDVLQLREVMPLGTPVSIV
jgi:hypothetical protein